MKETCFDCGGELVERGVSHETRGGRFTVSDRSSSALVCTKCGAPLFTGAQLNAYELRAVERVLRSVERPGGAVVKFARKALGFTQVELGKVLGYSAETISRYEQDAIETPRAVLVALLGLVEAAARGDTVRDLLTAFDDGPPPSHFDIRATG